MLFTELVLRSAELNLPTVARRRDKGAGIAKRMTHKNKEEAIEHNRERSRAYQAKKRAEARMKRSEAKVLS